MRARTNARAATDLAALVQHAFRTTQHTGRVALSNITASLADATDADLAVQVTALTQHHVVARSGAPAAPRRAIPTRRPVLTLVR